MSRPIPELARRQVRLLTGSQHLYGPETLQQVALRSQQVAKTLDESRDIPVTVVWKPVLNDTESIRRAALEANTDEVVIGVIAWIHLRPGQDVDHRLTQPGRAPAAPAHPAQRRVALGINRFRLHEPEPGRAR